MIYSPPADLGTFHKLRQRNGRKAGAEQQRDGVQPGRDSSACSIPGGIETLTPQWEKNYKGLELLAAGAECSTTVFVDTTVSQLCQGSVIAAPSSAAAARGMDCA